MLVGILAKSAGKRARGWKFMGSEGVLRVHARCVETCLGRGAPDWLRLICCRALQPLGAFSLTDFALILSWRKITESPEHYPASALVL